MRYNLFINMLCNYLYKLRRVEIAYVIEQSTCRELHSIAILARETTKKAFASRMNPQCGLLQFQVKISKQDRAIKLLEHQLIWNFLKRSI